MTTEGARNETALEMDAVLRVPEERLRQQGDVPGRLSVLHAGMNSINAGLQSDNESDEQKKLRAEAEALRKKLDALKAEGEKAREARDWKRRNKLIQEEQAVAAKLNPLLDQIDTLELEIANALWGEKTYPFTQAYLDLIGAAYETGGLRMADFRNEFEAERVRINQWVEEKTRDRIQDLLPEGSVNNYTRLALVNAIYFKADWATPFQSERTSEGEFTLADGKSITASLMFQRNLEGARFAAFNADGTFFKTPKMISSFDPEQTEPREGGFSMVELPYRGGEVSMVVIAPKDPGGLAAIEAMLNRETLDRWLGSMKERNVHVTLPKFKSETTYRLNSSLKAMGMVRAFTDPREPNGADFGGMSEATDPMQKLYITLVMHKAFVEVSEKGTEAAAATAVLVAVPTSAPATTPYTPHFKADRPFIYLIRDRATGAILFLGRMMNPAS